MLTYALHRFQLITYIHTGFFLYICIHMHMYMYVAEWKQKIIEKHRCFTYAQQSIIFCFHSVTYIYICICMYSAREGTIVKA